MPIFSYLAYPVKGQKNELIKDLSAITYCDVVPADNEDLVILVTDAPDKSSEKHLQEKLKGVKSLNCMSMTFGHVDQQTMNTQEDTV